MNPNKAKNKISRTTPPKLKKLLVGLLFISALAGYASAAYLMLRARSAIQSTIAETPKEHQSQTAAATSLLESMIPGRFERPKVGNFTGVRDLFRNPVEKEQVFMPLTFQGTLAGEEGAIAIVNDEPLALGTEIQGVKVIAISDRVLILEYKGETKKLGVGETVSVLMSD